MKSNTTVQNFQAKFYRFTKIGHFDITALVAVINTLRFGWSSGSQLGEREETSGGARRTCQF